MAWLNSWIKEIIVVVLIASFVDMLLPNKSMQRYVKTVVGLFLLMLLLTPVLRLFQMDWDTDKLLRSIEQQTSAVMQPAIAQTPPSASLEAVRQEAERLKALDAASAKKLVEERLAASVQEEVESRFDKQVAAVEVATALDPQGQLKVSSVRVILAAADRSLPAWAAVEPVKPFDPIRPLAPIAVGGSADEAAPAGAAASASPGNAAASGSKASPDAIADYIASTWQVDAKKIEIIRPDAEK